MAIDKTSSTTDSLLFSPLNIGPNIQLKHRIVMAPITRFRSTMKEHVPIMPMMKEYYSQRSRLPGSFVIAEASGIAEEAGPYDSSPGIWSEEQIKAWKEITDAVHSNGSYIFLQLIAMGRVAAGADLISKGFPYVAASAIPLKNHSMLGEESDLETAKQGDEEGLREATKEELEMFVKLFAQAAENAVFKAGFDGVELHGANGYFVDQFLQDVTNQRTDEYGGSIENRARYPLEIVKAVVDKVGAHRTAVRISPFGTFQEMKMTDPIPQFAYFVSQLASLYPTMAYLHVIEGRMVGDDDGVENDKESVDFLRAIWKSKTVGPSPFLSAGGYTRARALEHMKNPVYAANEAIVFGRYFISNPDLVTRFEKDLPLIKYNRATFYDVGNAQGYIDYPFAQV